MKEIIKMFDSDNSGRFSFNFFTLWLFLGGLSFMEFSYSGYYSCNDKLKLKEKTAELLFSKLLGTQGIMIPHSNRKINSYLWYKVISCGFFGFSKEWPPLNSDRIKTLFQFLDRYRDRSTKELTADEYCKLCQYVEDRTKPFLIYPISALTKEEMLSAVENFGSHFTKFWC